MRELLETVERGVFPDWLTAIVGGEAISPKHWFHRANGSGWLDHGGRLISNPEVLVGEPYRLDESQLMEILSFATMHGLRVSISGGSAWHPDTLHIEIKPIA